MSKISGKINLLSLKASIKLMKARSGEMECLVIPIELNNLFKGEKGVYLDFIGFELKEKKDKDTHLVKQSLPKDVREKMTEEEQKTQPIIGNLAVWSDTLESGQPVSNSGPIGEDDDLPF